MTDCLDSWAVLRWLEGAEPAASRVDAALRGRPVMSWVNMGEVFYILHRAAGEQAARDTVRQMRGRLQMDTPTEMRVLQAATIKAGHRMAYADAFAVATATAHHAVLLTGDPELIDGESTWDVEDLRA